MRTFGAIELPGLALPGGFPREGLSAPHHLTLRFLGEIPPEAVGRAREAFSDAVRTAAPFRLTVAGYGAFPDRHRPRIAFAEITDGRSEVVALARSLDDALARRGFPREGRPFVPHVTLARGRPTLPDAMRRAITEGPRGPTLGTAWVDAVVLFSSQLTPAGPIHVAVARFPLGSGLGGAPEGSLPSGRQD